MGSKLRGSTLILPRLKGSQDAGIYVCKANNSQIEQIYKVLTVTDLIAVPKAGIFAEGEGMTVAKNIVSKIQSKETSALFDGKGGCFIESGRDTASLIEVDMFSGDTPSTNLTDSTSEHLDEKFIYLRSPSFT